MLKAYEGTSVKFCRFYLWFRVISFTKGQLTRKFLVAGEVKRKIKSKYT